MYALINAKLASMEELKSCYTLDEALKLHAIWRMAQDVEAGHANEHKEKARNRGRRR